MNELITEIKQAIILIKLAQMLMNRSVTMHIRSDYLWKMKKLFNNNFAATK